MTEEIISIEKFSWRTTASENAAIKRRIAYLSALDYSVRAHRCPDFDDSAPIFTIILTLHDGGAAYILESLSSVFSQTYNNTEVILIDHGTTGYACNLILENFVSNRKAKLIRVENNFYDPESDEFENRIASLWNAALFCSQGEFAYFLSYDDSLSKDYAERMVALFEGNTNCCSAAPLVISIDEEGRVNEEMSAYFKKNNRRTRYTDGVALAEAYMNASGMISFPGGVLAQRTDVVFECGGFDAMNDLSQLFKFAINGVSGFDSDARLFWRHHKNQTNKKLKILGLVFYKLNMAFPAQFNIYELHMRVAGKDFADRFNSYLSEHASKGAVGSFRDSYMGYGVIAGYRALSRIFSECTYTEQSAALFYLIRDFPRMLFNNYVPVPVIGVMKNLKRRLTGRRLGGNSAMREKNQ